jgi:hypothetical protein
MLHSTGVDPSQPAPRMRQLARDQHRASVEKELEDDERKLKELEEKLAEVCKGIVCIRVKSDRFHHAIIIIRIYVGS